jgi:dihydroorotase-like cyclic amidohydrolase
LKKQFDLIIKNGLVYSQGHFHKTDVGVVGEKIDSMGDLSSYESIKTIDAKGLHVLPEPSTLKFILENPVLNTKKILPQERCRLLWVG